MTRRRKVNGLCVSFARCGGFSDKEMKSYLGRRASCRGTSDENEEIK